MAAGAVRFCVLTFRTVHPASSGGKVALTRELVAFAGAAPEVGVVVKRNRSEIRAAYFSVLPRWTFRMGVSTRDSPETFLNDAR